MQRNTPRIIVKGRWGFACLLVALQVPWLLTFLPATSFLSKAEAIVSVQLGLSLLAMGFFWSWSGSWGRRLQVLLECIHRIRANDFSAPSAKENLGSREDEIGVFFLALDQLRDSLLQVLGTVSSISNQTNVSSSKLTEVAKRINISAGEVTHSMEQVAQGVELQAELVGKTSALIEELAKSINHTSRSAEDAARSSAEASVVAQTGSQLAGKAVDKMRAVFEEIEKYAQRVFEFGERTKEIGNIVRVITEVAQQTHLLAINATIEAARAGEAGRGFAVVAEEIRQLADNTSRSAERIGGIVEEVTAGSEEAVQAVKASTRQLSEGRDQLTSIVDALKNIVATVTSGSDRVQMISRLAKEQIAGAEQTVKAFANISQVAQKNAFATEEVLAATETQSGSLLEVTRLASEILAMAQILAEQAGRFKTMKNPNEHTSNTATSINR